MAFAKLAIYYVYVASYYLCAYTYQQTLQFYVSVKYKDNPVYTVKKNLQCGLVCLYVKTEYPYYFVLTKILAVVHIIQVAIAS